MPSKRAKFRKKYKKNHGKLPGPPKGGRPPGVPWHAGKKNPSALEDIIEVVVPAGIGFGGTKVISRIAFGVADKRGSKWAKHIGALASVLTTGILWGVAHRVKKIAEHHTPLVVGSAVASLQSIIQTYIPRYGWLVGHPSEDPVVHNQVGVGDDVDYASMLSEPRGNTMNYDPSMEARQPRGGGRRRPRSQQPQSSAAQTAASVNGAADGDTELDQLLNEIQDENADLAQGVFQN